MKMFPESSNEYEGQTEAAREVWIDGQKIGELFVTADHGRGWHVVLCGRLGYSNAQFATREGAVKYMTLCAYAENHDIKF